MNATEPTSTRFLESNFIGGVWRTAIGGASQSTFNPMRPSELVGEYSASTAEDVDYAVGAAEAALAGWKVYPPGERGEVLRRAARLLGDRSDEIARVISTEMGKPYRESRVEVQRAVAAFDYYAGETLRSFGDVFLAASSGSVGHTLRRPIGVVGMITPWNFPIAIPACKIAPALAFGNTVVVKPSMLAPKAVVLLAECLAEAGVPSGVVNIVTGAGGTLGPPLIRHDAIAAISFTGSEFVGREIATEAARHGKSVQLELGGNNPLLVMHDADLDAAVEAAYSGAFWSAGQRCTATRRILVSTGVFHSFRERLLERIDRGKIGDPLDPTVEVGPVVNEQAVQDVLRAIDQAKAEGGSVATGGIRLTNDCCLIAPTLLENLDDESFIVREEVFGPVTSLFEIEDIDEAVHRANTGGFGLSASIFTRDLRAVDKFVRGVRAGILRINCPTAGTDLHIPAGGLGRSGYGAREQGRSAIEFYTELTSVYHEPGH